MSSRALKEQVDAIVNSMFTEGLLDQQFQQLQMLEDGSSPGFVAEVIKLFCDDAENILKHLTDIMGQAVIDYQKVGAYVHQLKGSSSSVGAQSVTLACTQFRQASDENNKEGCLRALNWVRNEYGRLQGRFQSILQLEQRIAANEGRRSN